MAEKMDKIFLKFMKKHWQMFIAIIVIAILAIMGAIYVFLWHVGEAQAINLVPEFLGEWTMEHLVTFILHLIFWVFVFVGIPVLITIAAIYFLWWKKIPEKERKEYRQGNLFKRSRTTDGGGIFSCLIFIVFLILVYLDGNWTLHFKNWEFNYLVYTWLWALFWVAVIIGIPILIGATLWIRHEMKKEA